MKFITLALFFVLFSTTVIANDKEDKLRGVILERVSQFITYNSQKDDFIICVYDDKSLANLFTKLYKDRKYKNRKIKVTNIKNIASISKCDILYAKEQNQKTFKKIIKHKQLYTLLVTDNVDALDDGFMMALYINNKKVNFAINQQAIVDANLKINYRLLKVASGALNLISV